MGGVPAVECANDMAHASGCGHPTAVLWGHSLLSRLPAAAARRGVTCRIPLSLPPSLSLSLSLPPSLPLSIWAANTRGSGSLVHSDITPPPPSASPERGRHIQHHISHHR